MTSYVTPKKNAAYKFYVGLIDQSNTKLLKANPTIASGDFKVSTDGGAFANLATLPSANPASGRAIMIDFSAGEMNGDNIVLQCVDAAGAEWCDLLVNIRTTARQIDDLAYPATTGRSMVVDANGLVDANTVKVGPTGAGTAQTAGDLKGTLGTPAGASLAADLAEIEGETDGIAAISTATPLTAAQIATGVWQDTVAGDFTVAASIGKSVMNGVALGTGLTVANLTNAPTAGDLTATMKTSVQTAADAAITANALVLEIEAETDGIAAIPTTPVTTAHFDAVIGTPAGASIAADLAEIEVETDDIAAIKAKTDNLPAAPADESLIIAATNAIAALIGTPAGASLAADLAEIEAETDAIASLPTAVQNADALLNRDMSVGVDSGSPTVRTVRQALRFLRNKWSLAAGTLTVTKEDDATASWTATVTTDASAVPIIGNDPA